MNPEELKRNIIEEAKNLANYVIEMRRKIHMNPETAFEEEETAKLIEEELHKMGYETQRVAGTGVVAVLMGKEDGKTVALRADIDALNIQEENDVPYKSKNPGKMHACGHDAHTASLLGAAKILQKYRDQIKGKIKLIFQPAEEGGGGGKQIVDAGVLDDVDYVFGMHVWKEQQAGKIGTRKGPMLASADAFKITIKGKGGHAASPYEAIDSTAVVADIYNALQKLITREIKPFESVILTIPMLQGSDAFNVIPNETVMKGTLRTFNPEVRNYIITRIEEVVDGFSKAWRCEGKFELEGVSYPPLINNPEIVESLQLLFEELGGVEEIEPSMGGEDFAFYLQKTKGAFVTLGIYNEEKGIIFDHHHPGFNVDEEILWKGAAIYALLGFYPLLSKK